MTAVAGGLTASADISGLALLTTGRPLVRLIASGTQSIPTGTSTAITFTGSEDIDTHNYHNPASNTSRITPLIAGYYQLSGFFVITTTTAQCEAYIGKNGSGVAGGSREGVITTGAARGYFATAMLQANGSSDYFELMGLQSSGSSVSTNQSGRISCTFEMEFLRPL